jgi:thiosulfate reductase cytochrome b subunit
LGQPEQERREAADVIRAAHQIRHHLQVLEGSTDMNVTERRLPDGWLALYRHPLPVRLTHWLNALCLFVLLPSGLQILNAHPALYWGQTSNFGQPWLALAPEGQHAAPSWLTLPGWQDLAAGRRWHFFFAWVLVVNGLAYLIYCAGSGRLRRLLLPRRGQLEHIGRSLLDHLNLRFPAAELARGYNVLQQLSYLAVILVLLPLMVLTGLTMSPGVDAWLNLPALLGGRQSARTLHFLAAALLTLFFLIHILAVLMAGPVREMRSMISGWLVIKAPTEGP